MLISPAHIEEFVLPYTARLAEAFDGAFVHYCGRHDGLTRALLAIPQVKILNAELVEGQSDRRDAEAEMELVVASGKVFCGQWPREYDETGRAYIERLHHLAAEGHLATFLDRAIDGQTIRSAEEAFDLWCELSQR